MYSKTTTQPVHHLRADGAFRRELSQTLRRSKKSREEIAEALSDALGVRVSVGMLTNFTSLSRANYKFPAAWVSALCDVTGDNSLRKLLLGGDLWAALDVASALMKEQRVARNSDIKQSGARR